MNKTFNNSMMMVELDVVASFQVRGIFDLQPKQGKEIRDCHSDLAFFRH